MNLRVVLTVPDFDEAAAFHRERRVSGPVRLAVEVADPDDLARRLIAAGATAEAPPVIPPWGGRNARLRTADGMQPTLFGDA